MLERIGNFAAEIHLKVAFVRGVALALDANHEAGESAPALSQQFVAPPAGVFAQQFQMLAWGCETDRGTVTKDRLGGQERQQHRILPIRERDILQRGADDGPFRGRGVGQTAENQNTDWALRLLPRHERAERRAPSTKVTPESKRDELIDHLGRLSPRLGSSRSGFRRLIVRAH